MQAGWPAWRRGSGVRRCPLRRRTARQRRGGRGGRRGSRRPRARRRRGRSSASEKADSRSAPRAAARSCARWTQRCTRAAGDGARAVHSSAAGMGRRTQTRSSSTARVTTGRRRGPGPGRRRPARGRARRAQDGESPRTRTSGRLVLTWRLLGSRRTEGNAAAGTRGTLSLQRPRHGPAAGAAGACGGVASESSRRGGQMFGQGTVVVIICARTANYDYH